MEEGSEICLACPAALVCSGCSEASVQRLWRGVRNGKLPVYLEPFYNAKFKEMPMIVIDDQNIVENCPRF